MNKYKVIGDKLNHFYTIVTAPTKEAAWDIATNRDDLTWFEIEMDTTIDPYEIEEVEELEVKLNNEELEDDWPSMDNNILISGNSDK